MKFLKSALITIALILSVNVNAALITADFTSTVLDGDFAGSVAVGSFTYEDSLITGSGYESINVFQGLTVNLIVFGQEFSEQDDIDITNGLPALEFNNGIAFNLDFWISENPEWSDGYYATDVTSINQSGINSIGEFSLNEVAEDSFEGNFTVSAVPVPAAVWLFSSGLIGLVGLAKRKKA